MTIDAAAAREALRRRLLGLGFDAVRFARIGPPADRGLRAWLGAGHHAGMAWMEATAAKREDPGLVLAGAGTAIVLGVNTWPGEGRAASPGPWARYSLHEDYHDTLRPGLAAAGRAVEEELGLGPDDHRYYTDSGPVLERGWAAEAGLGFLGRNGMLISREFGNWLLLGVVLVRAVLPPDPPLRDEVPAAARRRGDAGPVHAPGLLCGKCTRCLDACPTAAFAAPGIVDARRCISYHTIENRGPIPRELRAAFGARLFGCDVCLEVCPWNRFAQAGRSMLLARRHDLADLRLLDVLGLTVERWQALFRRTPIKRAKLPGLLRNACVAAGNVWHRDPARRAPVNAAFAAADEASAGAAAVALLARHESPVVRAHAVWALRRMLGVEVAAARLGAARAAETDPLVRAEWEAPEDAGAV